MSILGSAASSDNEGMCHNQEDVSMLPSSSLWSAVISSLKMGLFKENTPFQDVTHGHSHHSVISSLPEDMPPLFPCLMHFEVQYVRGCVTTGAHITLNYLSLVNILYHNMLKMYGTHNHLSLMTICSTNDFKNLYAEKGCESHVHRLIASVKSLGNISIHGLWPFEL